MALQEYSHTQLPLVTDYLPHIGMGEVFIWIYLNECKQEESSLK